MAASKSKKKPYVEAVWHGRPKYFPREDRIVRDGDTVMVTQEQLDDPNTPCGPKAARSTKTTSSGSDAADRTED